MARKQRSPGSATDPRWPDLPIGWRSEPFQFGPLLRAARLGLARQSSGFLRRLEQQRDVRASISRTRHRHYGPKCPLKLWFGRAVPRSQGNQLNVHRIRCNAAIDLAGQQARRDKNGSSRFVEAWGCSADGWSKGLVKSLSMQRAEIPKLSTRISEPKIGPAAIGTV